MNMKCFTTVGVIVPIVFAATFLACPVMGISLAIEAYNLNPYNSDWKFLGGFSVLSLLIGIGFSVLADTNRKSCETKK